MPQIHEIKITKKKDLSNLLKKYQKMIIDTFFFKLILRKKVLS